jgi:SAM-dependent methyltransferase
MSMAMQHSHTGWETYYRAHQDERAWGGVPDGFLMEHIEALLPAGAKSVIDVAAGDGRNSEPFLSRGMQVVATDLSTAALETFGRRCRTLEIGNPVLLEGDFLSLGLMPGQFDAAVCFNSIPHFEAPDRAIAKIVTLLRVGGRAAFNAFTPGDVAFGQGFKVGTNRYTYLDTLFTFLTEGEVTAILPASVTVLHSETRRWEEPDHGTYRRGTHTHEACFFIIEKRAGAGE